MLGQFNGCVIIASPEEVFDQHAIKALFLPERACVLMQVLRLFQVIHATLDHPRCFQLLTDALICLAGCNKQNV